MSDSTRVPGRRVRARATLPAARPGEVEAELVLVYAPDNVGHPYVTWQRNVADGSTYWGHYHETLELALSDFHERRHAKHAMPAQYYE